MSGSVSWLASGNRVRIEIEIFKGQCDIQCRYDRNPTSADVEEAHTLVDVIMKHLNMQPIKEWSRLKPENKRVSHA